MFATKSNDILHCQHAFDCVMYDRIARRSCFFFKFDFYKAYLNFVCCAILANCTATEISLELRDQV